MVSTLEKSPVLNLKEQNIKLIDGSFNSSEASDIINAMLDVKINFHKVQRLVRTEGNSNDLCEFDNGRIVELLEAKNHAKTYFSDARLNGKKLKIVSQVTIAIED